MTICNKESECCVYQVKVSITVGEYNPGKENPEYVRVANVLAISEKAAVKKVKRQFQWDLREVLKNASGYVIGHEVKLLVENVTY